MSTPDTDHAIVWSLRGDSIVIGNLEASNTNLDSEPKPKPKHKPKPKPKPKPNPNQAHKAKPADEQARVAYARAKVEFAAFQKAKKARVGAGGAGGAGGDDGDDGDGDDDDEADVGEARETSRLLGDDAFLCKLCGCSVAAAAAATHLGGAKHALRVQMLMAVCEATPPKKGDWVCCARRPKHTNDQPQLNYAANSGTQPRLGSVPTHPRPPSQAHRRPWLPPPPPPSPSPPSPSPFRRSRAHSPPTTAHSSPTTAHATAAATHRPPLPRRLLQGRLRRRARHDGSGLR